MNCDKNTLTFGGDLYLSSAPVLFIDHSAHESFLFQPVDNAADGYPVAGDKSGQCHLVKFRGGRDRAKRSVLHRRYIMAGLRHALREDGDRYLMQAAD